MADLDIAALRARVEGHDSLDCAPLTQNELRALLDAYEERQRLRPGALLDESVRLAVENRELRVERDRLTHRHEELVAERMTDLARLEAVCTDRDRLVAALREVQGYGWTALISLGDMVDRSASLRELRIALFKLDALLRDLDAPETQGGE